MTYFKHNVFLFRLCERVGGRSSWRRAGLLVILFLGVPSHCHTVEYHNIIIWMFLLLVGGAWKAFVPLSQCFEL